MVQMIGSAIQPTSWQQWAPAPSYGGGGAPGNSGGGGWGNIGGAGAFSAAAIGMMANRGGGPSNAAAVYAMQQGAGHGLLGNLSTAVSAGGLANSYGMFGTHVNAAGQTVNGNPQVGGALGTLGGGLQFIQGMQRGGVQGYGSAAVGGLRAAAGMESLMGNPAMAGTLGAAAGYIAAPLALYSAIKNWQSGNTASDTIQGAEAGAAIGSIIPGVGTLIGGVIGGVVGAASSAFGGGQSSAEAGRAQNADKVLAGATDAQRAQAIGTMSPTQSFQTINGYMNAHDSSVGHSEPIQQAFGKNGVSNMFGQMMPAINAAIAKDPKLGSLSSQDMYSQVIAPWLKSKGASIDPNQKDKNGNNEGKNLVDAITGFVGNWMSGAVNSQSPIGISGQTISNMPTYRNTAAPAPAPTPIARGAGGGGRLL